MMINTMESAREFAHAWMTEASATRAKATFARAAKDHEWISENAGFYKHVEESNTHAQIAAYFRELSK